MDKYKTNSDLLKLFRLFKYHDDVLSEVMQLVVNKGLTTVFISLLRKNIKMMEELGGDVTRLSNFEKLKGADGLYSMKFKGHDMNLRIIYSYDGNSCTVLLCCFDEKSDSKKNRYKKHIEIAQKRKKELEDKNENQLK